MIQFALFPVDTYNRDQVVNMTDSEIMKAINNDSNVITYTAGELAELLNDEAYPTEYWTACYNF